MLLATQDLHFEPPMNDLKCRAYSEPCNNQLVLNGSSDPTLKHHSRELSRFDYGLGRLVRCYGIGVDGR